MEVNERIFKMYLYLKHHEFDRSSVADLLDITSRQLTRLLNKWQEEGILNYTSGVGRGNASDLTFNVNIEGEFINYLIRNLDKFDMAKLQEIMDYDMADSSRKILRACIDNNLFLNVYDDVPRTYHVDYFYRLPHILDPLGKIDFTLAMLLVNLGTRLYYTQGEDIRSHMVAYDEWIDNDFVIYLNRNIRFSNGDLLHASDVKDCLLRMKEVRNDLSFSSIQSIEVLSAVKLVIHFTRRIESLKLTLSQEFSTIYKQVDDDFIFTGPYRVLEQSDEMIKLTYNKYHHYGVPDITDLIFVNDIQKYQEYSKKHHFTKKSSNQYYSMDVLLFNPHSTLTFEERQFIASLSQHQRVEGRVEKTVKLLKIKDSKKWIDDIIGELMKHMTVEVIEIPFDDFINQSLLDFDVDIAFINENLAHNRMGYDLLTDGKLVDWYKDMKRSKELLYVYHYRHQIYWPYIDRNYMQFLLNERWMIIIKEYGRNLHFPGYFENIATNAHGVINYASIKKLNEVIHHDR